MQWYSHVADFYALSNIIQVMLYGFKAVSYLSNFLVNVILHGFYDY